jgi:Ni/Co efflux regulator RcnB
MSITRTLITSTAAVLVMVAALGASEAAQRSGAQKHHNNDSMQNSGAVRHVDKKRGPRISKNRHHNRYVRSRKGSGIYIGLGESSRCAYSHRKWRATSSRYWRSRYYDCLSG